MLYKNVNGISIAYEMKGQGPALVLLHGFSLDSRMWRRQLDIFAEKFTVIAWVAPGAGKSSDPPETFTINDWADCLSDFLNSIGVNKANILGLSWGGILTQEFYSHHSRKISSLILADTYAGWKGSLPEHINDERPSSCIHDSLLPPDQFVKKYLPGMFSDSASMNVQDEAAGIMAGFHPLGFRLMALASAIDTSELLPAIKVPTLLIWGEQDKRSPVIGAVKMQALIPGAKLEIIPEAGHISNLEQPSKFNKIVIDFYLSLNN